MRRTPPSIGLFRRFPSTYLFLFGWATTNDYSGLATFHTITNPSTFPIEAIDHSTKDNAPWYAEILARSKTNRCSKTTSR